MSQRLKYLLKNIGILTISNFASKILVFILVPLYTSVLTTGEYGTYDLLVSMVSMIFPILTLNIVDAVMRFCMDRSNSKKDIAIIGIKYIIVSIGVVGLFLLIIYIFDFFPIITQYVPYLFLYYMSYVLNQYFLQLAKGHERVKDMGVAGIASTVVMLFANIFCLFVLKMGLIGFFIANILGQFIPVIYYFIRLKYWKYIEFVRSNKKLEKEMLIYCVPLITTVLGWWINNAADKYIVAVICGLAANGILSVAYKMPNILHTLHSIFIQAWQISAVKEFGENKAAEFYGRIFLYLNIILTIVCAGLIVLSKPLASILYSKEFYVAWQYVPFLLISSIFNSASGLIGSILSAKKDSKAMALSAVYGAIANIILNIIFVKLAGIQGATVATLVSSIVIYAYRKRAVRDELKVEKYWKILISWMLLIVQALIEIYSTMWYFEFAIIAIIIIINSKDICDAIGSFKKKRYNE